MKSGSEDAKHLSLFAESLLFLFQKGKIVFTANPGRWQGIAEEQLRPSQATVRAWKTRLGMIGYRDVYDMLRAAAECKESSDEIKRAKHVLFSTSPRFLSLVVKGKAAAMAREALEKSFFQFRTYDVQLLVLKSLFWIPDVGILIWESLFQTPWFGRNQYFLALDVLAAVPGFRFVHWDPMPRIPD